MVSSHENFYYCHSSIILTLLIVVMFPLSLCRVDHARFGTKCTWGRLIKGGLFWSQAQLRRKNLDEAKIEKTEDPEKACKICMENVSSIAYLPCGHMITCAECAALTANCSMCRRKIVAFARIFA